MPAFYSYDLFRCRVRELDTDTFTLSVSPDRLCEIELLLVHWIRKRTAFKTALQSLVGKLIFISKCVRFFRHSLCNKPLTLIAWKR